MTTALLCAYRNLTAAALPFAMRGAGRKLRAHGVGEDRIRERLGHATEPRPDAPLIWFHAASVGESLSVLTLIRRMGDRLPGHEFLITSGTATSAAILAKRMPPRCRHQFAALDAPGPVARFLAHWRPDAAIFVESELWPLTLTATRATGARLALLNARMSAKSVRGWSKFPKTARAVLDSFSVFLTQNAIMADHLRLMGADPARIRPGSNLKASSDPLPVDQAALAELQTALGPRPVWAASSTHPGEEAEVIAAHKALLARHPDLCLILIPRHPERGSDVAALLHDAGLSHARRSAGEALGADMPVYLADTMGETGTWYAAAPIVFLGGSLKPIGGHNPYEPAASGAAILTGRHVTNFAESFDPLLSLGGAQTVADGAEMARAVAGLLTDPGSLDQMRDAAGRFHAASSAALDGVVDLLVAELALEDG